MSPISHSEFPIASGEHALDCASCHTDPNTFSVFNCIGCHTHDQAPTDLVHNSVGTYAYTSAACYQCHSAPTPAAYTHTGITGNCALCHAVGASFAALPQAGFTHIAITADCGSCHTTKAWSTAAMPSTLIHDTAKNVTVTALVPAYSGTSINKVSPVAEVLPMSMDHSTAALASTVLTNCAGCHAGAAAGNYYPGVLHSSLANQSLAQPAACFDCHGDAAPTGFVGPLAAHPPRSPASGEMKHDAVAWTAGAPTSTHLVTADCSVCHVSPSSTVQATWATSPSGSGSPAFHASLTRARLAQPSSCVDCHANTRPGVLTSATASVPAGLSYDHGSGPALGDCASCHAASAAGGFASWAGGRFHLVQSSTPTSCLPCHSGQRPTSASGWASTTYSASPFDYGTNASGVTHGDGQDCATCHNGPGTGTWGTSQNWVGGAFPHGAGTPAATTCIACHMSERPDLQPGTTAAAMAALLGFDHSVNGTGDCFACHQATVAAGRYVAYQPIPGGDWKGGASYPGSTFASAKDQFITVAEISLVRTGTLVTGTTSITATLYDGIVHTSSAIPSAVSPGPAGSPNSATCWHCHTNTNGTVTSFANGKFHSALTNYSATPGGTVVPFPQPTSQCNDCHAQMRPTGIVEKAGADLQTMDHSALFTNGSGVASFDCSSCHKSPGSTWADGVFHANIGSAVPQDCTVCHYPLMADSARADVASGNLYGMDHRSPTITQQKCDLCHLSALSQSTGTPASALWHPGVFHPSVSPQPSACLDCHSGSAPTAPTQSTVTYQLAAGGTSTNGAQWMNHGAAAVVGLDCAKCHASDAVPSGAAWSKSTLFHASVPSPGTCQNCHGLTNGNGSTIGSGNNMPVGLTNSSMLTTASNDSTTGVPAGTHDQVTHADVNVGAFDCAVCHTQAGPSTVAGIQGKEWAQASFHTSFSAVTPLTMNGTTGRCSDCHMNVKPGATFTAQDHSAFTSVAGTQDCSACHAWPGTGTASAPNWLGGGGAPQYIFVGGFAIPQPPATTPSTQTGITNLPHPSTATLACSTCHTGGVGGTGAIGYDHASTLINTNCNSCHEAGTNLVGTLWNGSTTQSGGAGDSRPYTITSLTATRGGDSCKITTPNHFYPVDCGQCHNVPAGTGATTAGSAYTNAWTFPHTTSKMTNPSTCNLCHSGQGCGT
ncbi:MAG TPA: hypothetical protein VFG53_01475 [Anaeromyxobacter sp.]|nr:hypothetical protein [Anaeromyxobacter sp.]